MVPGKTGEKSNWEKSEKENLQQISQLDRNVLLLKMG